MFNLEFFKDKIDTTKIHNQTPPIDPEVVESINREIKENDNEESKTDHKPKFHKYQILHDGTAYEGEWLNNMRHGKGTQFKLSDDNKPIKIYQGDWIENMRDGEGTQFKPSDDNKPIKIYEGLWMQNEI